MSKLIQRRATVEAENFSLRSKFPNGFCSAPFSQLYIHATGDVYVCCQHQGHLGNLKTHSLQELWNGERALELRREFLKGGPRQCKKLMENIGCHMNYDEFLKYASFEERQCALPRVLEVVLNGKCNIDCKMCDIKNSVMSLLDIPNFKTEIEDKLFPVLSHIYIKGGEPLIQRETYHVLEQLKKVNPKCTWRFTTNGQYNFNESMKKQLEGLELERVTFSIDSSHAPLYEKIRVRGSLAKCEKSLLRMKEWALTKNQKRPIEFTINITVQKDNWRDVPDTFRHYHEQGHSPCLIYVYWPSTYSLSTLGPSEQAEVIKYYLGLSEDYDIYMGSLYHVLRPLLQQENHQIKKLKVMWDMRMQDISLKQGPSF